MLSGIAYESPAVRITSICRVVSTIICKDKDNIEAQYSLEAYNLPLGISQYELSKLIPNEIKTSLPSIEEIESTLEQLSENDKD